jgi:hypothetical protein
MLYILGGFLLCQCLKELRYKISMNFMISIVVFKYFLKEIVDPHHPKDQVNPLFLWYSNANCR